MDERGRVLVIDGDLESNTADVLRADDRAVGVAVSGVDGLRQASRSYPDLVIVDLDLADLPGIEVVRALRETRDRRLAAVPVIITAAASRASERLIVRLGGAFTHLTKPIAAADLLREVERGLDIGPEPLGRRRRQARTLRALTSDPDDGSVADALVSSAAIFGIGPDGTCLFANDKTVEMYGYRLHEMIGQPLHELIHHSRRDGSPQPVEESSIHEALAERRPRAVELDVFWHRDGSPIWASYSVVPSLEGDEVTGAVVTISSFTSTVQAAQAAVARFRALVQNSSEIVLVLGREETITYAGAAVQRVAGYRPDDLTGTSVVELVHPDDRSHFSATVASRLADPDDSTPVEFRVRFADGTWHWIDATLTDLCDDPAVGGVVINARDVTSRHQALESLRASEERYRTIVETAHEGIWIADLDGLVLFANPTLASLLGYESPAEIIGRSAFEVMTPEENANARRNLAKRKAGKSGVYERRFARPDGTEVWVRVAGTPLHDSAGTVTGSLAVLTDMTATRQAAENLRRQALHDGLTGLVNRAGLNETFFPGVRRGSTGRNLKAALLLIDLDRFQEINASLGHGAGDEVLKEFARRLVSVTSPSDVVARTGGDEFAVLAPGLSGPTEAVELARTILGISAQPFAAAGMQVAVSASIGVAHAPTHTDDFKILFQDADVAVHQAKDAGRGTWAIYDPTDNDNRPARLGLIVDLRQAIAQEELTLHYQPKVDLTTGEVLGVEALARWTHPTRGSVPPGEFMPLAEHSGLAGPLSVWALTTALAQCAAWQAVGLHLPVAVNITPSEFRHASFASMVADALTKSTVPPGDLTIEITEASLVEASPTVESNLATLQRLGVRLSIDDFGTGYSTLSYLNRLPIDEVKIDQSFVLGVVDDERDARIVEAITALGHSLGLLTVAEGIESDAIEAVLRPLGCAGQGFEICPPRPADEITEWCLARAGAGRSEEMAADKT